MGFKNWYVADFETTSYQTYLKEGLTRVWLWAIADENGKRIAWGSNIDSFIGWCKSHPHNLIYFHNLKFDGSFILSWLLENKFEYDPELNSRSNMGFNCLIDEMGAYYQIKIQFKHNCNVTFYDSLKLIPLSVKSIGEAFHLPEQKLKIDYANYEINVETIEYVFHDVIIVARAMKFFKDQNFNKMTIGGVSYNLWADKFGNGLKKILPPLGIEFHEKWRPAYRGGRCQVNPGYAGKVLTGVRRYDMNSMYPHELADKPMPYGEPIPIERMGTYEFELYIVEISFQLLKGHMPTLLKSTGLFASLDSYYIDSDGLITLTICNIDLEIMYRHYKIDYIRLIEGVGFKTTMTLFTDFINEFYEKKTNSEGGFRLIFKLILNNLYGKYGSKIKGRHKIPYLNSDKELKFEESDEEEMKEYYLPIAIAVTAQAHLDLDNAICEAGGGFVYCDTDSVHMLGSLPDSFVDQKRLGAFKLEGIETKSKYLRPKTYIYEQDGEIAITCAGMPANLKTYLINTYGDKVYDEFYVGAVFENEIPDEAMKLRSKVVRGGTVLVPTPYAIKR